MPPAVGADIAIPGKILCGVQPREKLCRTKALNERSDTRFEERGRNSELTRSKGPQTKNLQFPGAGVRARAGACGCTGRAANCASFAGNSAGNGDGDRERDRLEPGKSRKGTLRRRPSRNLRQSCATWSRSTSTRTLACSSPRRCLENPLSVLRPSSPNWQSSILSAWRTSSSWRKL